MRTISTYSKSGRLFILRVMAIFQQLASGIVLGAIIHHVVLGGLKMAHFVENRTVPPRNLRRHLAQIAIVFAAQFAAGKLGDILQTTSSGGIGPVWPAAGIALGAVLVWGYSVWPGIAVGAFSLTFLSGLPLWAAVVYAAGTTMAALLPAFVLRSIVKFDNTLSHLGDVVGLIVLGAFGGSAVSASIGVPTLYAAHIFGWSGIDKAWLIYWLGDSTGVLVVTPLVLTLPTLFRVCDRNRLIELTALLLLLTAASFIVFGILPIWLDILTFAVLPFVMWAALRFGVSATALSIFLLASIATVQTALGYGPFAANTPLVNAVLLDVLFGVVSITGLTLAAVGAERERSLRQQVAMEGQLLAGEALRESEARFRDLAEQSHTTNWEVDLQGLFTYVSDVSQGSWGYRPDEVVGRMHFYNLHPEEGQEAFKAAVFAVVERKQPFRDVVHTVETKDGRIVWASTNGVPLLNADGTLRGYRGSCADITERKRAEDALRGSEIKYRTVVELTGTGFVVIDSQGRVLDANQEYVHLSGHGALREILGRSVIEWTAEGAKQPNAEAVARCAKDRSIRNFVTEYVDGKGHATFIEVNATVEGEGEALRIVALCRDVTERVRREQTIRELSGRLITAQEEERSRIARELHDDINQRIGLLAIELERWDQQLPESAVDLHDQIHHGSHRLLELSKDVQALSHRLHSSKLEYLGIVVAANTFCKELSEQQNVLVQFTHSDIPRIVPKEISLSLFRVLQEALQNAVKHSGARQFQVELRGTPDKIQLTVSDLGTGFDPQVAMNREGLGLISMRERLGLVNGQLSITSAPGAGTTIQACVPFSSSSGFLRAG